MLYFLTSLLYSYTNVTFGCDGYYIIILNHKNGGEFYLYWSVYIVYTYTITRCCNTIILLSLIYIENSNRQKSRLQNNKLFLLFVTFIRESFITSI